jgi:haloalkane dehalogenase
MAVDDRRKLSAAAKAGLLAPYDSWRNRVAIQRFVEDIPLRPEHPSYATLRALEEGLARLQELPVALVWGLRDWCFTPWFRDRFLDFFPRAEQYDIADAGHYVMEEAPERVIQSIETFMSRHPCPTDRTS